MRIAHVSLGVFVLLKGVCAFGAEQPLCALSVDQPAYTLSPIWVHVQFREGPDLAGWQEGLRHLRYPLYPHPQSFKSLELELRRGGKTLPRLEEERGGCFSGPAFGSAAPLTSPEGRLPLHLFHRISEPGSYEVRLTGPDYTPGAARRGERKRWQSEWTPFEVLPLSEEARQAYVEQLMSSAPTDPGLIVGDFLPSLLAVPDAQVLPAFTSYFSHGDEFVQAYAINSLSMFDETLACDAVLREVDAHGASQAFVEFVGVYKDLLQSQTQKITDALIKHLVSEDVSAIGWNIEALKHIRSLYALPKGSDLLDRMDTAVMGVANTILASDDSYACGALAVYAGVSNIPGARDLLWRLAENPKGRAQALICLGWIGHPDDFQKLADLMQNGTQEGGVYPEILEGAYGKRALPALHKAMVEAADPKVRVECAKVLARYNSADAFQFFKDAIQNNRPYSETAESVLIDLIAPEMRSNERSIADPAERKNKLVEILDRKLEGTGVNSF